MGGGDQALAAGQQPSGWQTAGSSPWSAGGGRHPGPAPGRLWAAAAGDQPPGGGGESAPELGRAPPSVESAALSRLRERSDADL